MRSLYDKSVDEKFAVKDYRQLENQGNPNPLLQGGEKMGSILAREFVVRGEALFRVEASTSHGLSCRDIEISTAKRGVCYRRIECEEGDEGAKAYKVALRGQTLEGWTKRVAMPDEEAIRKVVNAASPEELAGLRVLFGALTTEELIRSIPQQKRGDIRLGSAVKHVSGCPYLDTLSLQRLERVKAAVKDIAKSSEAGEEPDKMGMSVWIETLRASSIEAEDLLEQIQLLIKAKFLRQEALELDGDHDPLQGVDPEPAPPVGWGISREVLAHVGTAQQWQKYLDNGYRMVTEGEETVLDSTGKEVKSNKGQWFPAMTRGEMQEFALHAGADLFDNNAREARRPPSWKELRAAILRVESNYEAEVEEWVSRRDPAGCWANLGAIVNDLTTWTGDDISSSLHDGFDVRPKPGISEASAELMNPEAEYYQQRLQSGGTPNERSVWCGDTGPYAEALPYNLHKNDEGWLEIGGHPLARQIDALMNATKSERDPVTLGLVRSASEVSRFIVPSCVEPEDWEDSEGGIRKVIYLNRMLDNSAAIERWDFNGGYGPKPPYQVLNPKALRVDLLTEIKPAPSAAGCVTFLGNIIWKWPGIGYVHKMKIPLSVLLARKAASGSMKYRIRVRGDEDSPLVVNPREPFNALFDDWNDIPETMTFRSRADYQAKLLQVQKVPTLVLVPDEESGLEHPEIVWKLGIELFPVMCRWAEALADRYSDGEEGCMDAHVPFGNEEGEGDYFEQMYRELSVYQATMVRTLALGSLHLVREFAQDVDDALHAAVFRPSDFAANIWTNAYGQQTNVYGAFFKGKGEGRLWETVGRLQNKTNEVLLPEEAYRDNKKLMWRALGWTTNGNYGPRGLDYLYELITEFYYRDNPSDKRRMTIGGQAVYGAAKYAMDVSVTNFGLGMLGDMAMQLKNVVFPKVIPGLPQLFLPSEEDWLKGGNWNAALAIHVAKQVPAHLWGANAQRRAVKLAQTWGRVRHYSGQDMEAAATRRFVDEMFPVPVKARPLTLQQKALKGASWSVGDLPESVTNAISGRLKDEFVPPVKAVKPKQEYTLVPYRESTFVASVRERLMMIGEEEVLQAFLALITPKPLPVKVKKVKGVKSKRKNAERPYDTAVFKGEKEALEREKRELFKSTTQTALLKESRSEQRRAVHYRFLAMSHVPIAGRYLLQATNSLVELDKFGLQRLNDILRDETERLGPMKVLLMQRASALLNLK